MERFLSRTIRGLCRTFSSNPEVCASNPEPKKESRKWWEKCRSFQGYPEPAAEYPEHRVRNPEPIAAPNPAPRLSIKKTLYKYLVILYSVVT